MITVLLCTLLVALAPSAQEPDQVMEWSEPDWMGQELPAPSSRGEAQGWLEVEAPSSFIDERPFPPAGPTPPAPPEPEIETEPEPQLVGQVERGASRLAATAVGEVELSAARWSALRSGAAREPGPMLLRREVRLRAAPGGVDVTARYEIEAPRAGWFATQLLGPDAHLRRATWNGKPAVVWSGGQGPLVVERAEGTATLELRAFVPGRPGDGLALPLLGAPQGTVVLEGFADDIELRGSDERPVIARGGRFDTGAGELQLAPKKPEPRDRGPLLVASVGLGVTVGDAEVRGRARLRWEIRQGTREVLSFAVAGVGEDLSVEGPAVGRWERAGDQVRVELNAPTQGLVDLDLRWSIATPRGAEATVPLPSLVPQDVFRATAAVQVARDGEVDVKPALERPWRAIAQAQLPAFAEGLVEGSPTAAYVRPRAAAGADALQLLRLEPVPGPPMVVDVADIQLATTEPGRVLLQARYEVRNERASHLTITPPPGMRLVGVEVAGRPVTPAHDGDAVRVPVKRSIETIKGLVTVPVMAAFVGQGDAWDRRERRDLLLPAVGAPVSVSRVTLHLPPKYRSRVSAGEHDVVEVFSRGQGVAYGLRDADDIAAADRLFASAVDAWNANEFERAQDRLDELARMSAAADNTEGLQANVDLVRPRSIPESEPEGVTVYDFEDDNVDGEVLSPDGAFISSRSRVSVRPAPAAKDDGAVARRIRARLRARSGSKKAQFERRKRKAKQLRNEGQYEAAAAEYRQAIEDSRDLEALEDAESVEYDFAADELAGELQEVEAASRSSIMKLVTDDAELDLIGGVFVVLRASEDPLDADAEAEPAPPPPTVGPLVRIPAVGQVVRYQHALLAAGEQRALTVDAVRARPRLRARRRSR